ncbi:MAG: ABC-F family ATP-binding cassette domain-containing protein, partial [Patescibacteria group bacterium]
MLIVKNLSKSYGPHTALAGVSFNLGKGQKAALVGPNGIGKSTLLRILAKEELSDSGTVDFVPGTEIAYLSQEVAIEGNETIERYLKRVTGVLEIEEQMRSLEEDLAGSEKLAKYGELQERYLRMDGYNFDHRISVFLAGFGLNQLGTDFPIDSLSGGQKTKVALVGILLKEPDLILLDEPTNNLDLPALVWLEEFLRRSKSALLVVSHDRQFLDAIVSKVFEIGWQTHALTEFPGTYSDFLTFKEKEAQRLRELYGQQQEEIDRLAAAAREKRIDAAKGAQYQGTDNDRSLRGFKRERAAKSGEAASAIEKRIDQLEKERIDKPKEQRPLEIPLDLKSRISGAIALEEVAFSYPNFNLGPLSFSLPAGSRTAIMGTNGSGKSTLLKLIGGQLQPSRGVVKVGPSLVIGSLMQFHEDLPLGEEVLRLLTEEGKIGKQEGYNLLSKFRLNETKADQPIGKLSPGERARVVLALFAARRVNVLLLDEPTNHLDIDAIGALEEVLSNYQGTVVAVSHDRRFLNRIRPEHLYLVKGGQLK